MFFGEGVAEAVAQEGSLKMKELTYLHCQCFSIVNISNNFVGYIKQRTAVPCIFVVLDDTKERTIKVMSKLQKYSANIFPVIISDCEDSETLTFFKQFTGSEKQIFTLKRSGPALSALQFIIPLQRLAYDTTIALGYDPDRPRNLAKELTTQ